MSINELARAEVRRMIVESAQWLTEHGRPTFARADVAGALPPAARVSPRTLAFELESLRITDKVRRIRESSGRRPALYALPDMVDDRVAPTAPDFKPGYPSTGTKIGPAWAAMWALLADDDWHDAADLAVEGAQAGGCLPGTARNLLFPAAKEGLIEVEVRYDEQGGKRWRSWYRRAR